VGACLWVWLVAATTSQMQPGWDVGYYVDMARHGVLGNPRLAAPFAYRPGLPLVWAGAARILGLPLDDTIYVVAWVCAVAGLVLAFLLARTVSSSPRDALLATAVTGLSATHVKFPLYYYALVDVAGYVLMIASLLALARGRRRLALGLGYVGLAFKEFLIVPIVLVAAAEVRRRRPIRRGLLASASILAVAAALVTAPRLLIHVALSYQEIDPLNAPGTLNRLFLNPLDLKRDLNLVLSVLSYCLPLLLLASPRRLRAALGVLGPWRLLLAIYVGIVLVLALYGGTNLLVFVSYAVAAQVMLLALLGRGVHWSELVLVLVAVAAYNRLLLDFPDPRWDVGAYLDFFPGWWDSRVNAATSQRFMECGAWVACAWLWRLARARAGRGHEA
jgi:hypothetical protein